jgi:hypothetical protein
VRACPQLSFFGSLSLPPRSQLQAYCIPDFIHDAERKHHLGVDGASQRSFLQADVLMSRMISGVDLDEHHPAHVGIEMSKAFWAAMGGDS